MARVPVQEGIFSGLRSSPSSSEAAATAAPTTPRSRPVVRPAAAPGSERRAGQPGDALDVDDPELPAPVQPSSAPWAPTSSPMPRVTSSSRTDPVAARLLENDPRSSRIGMEMELRIVPSARTRGRRGDDLRICAGRRLTRSPWKTSRSSEWESPSAAGRTRTASRSEPPRCARGAQGRGHRVEGRAVRRGRTRAHWENADGITRYLGLTGIQFRTC